MLTIIVGIIGVIIGATIGVVLLLKLLWSIGGDE